MTTELTIAIGNRDRVFVKVGDYAGNTVVAEVNAEEPSFLPGDCDLNGTVNIADAVLALRHSMGLITLTGEAFLAGDVDGNGSIAITDAVMIMRYAMGLIDEF